jgi:hypothetical protein
MTKATDLILLTTFTVAALTILYFTTIPTLIFINTVKVSATTLAAIYCLYAMDSSKEETLKVSAE